MNGKGEIVLYARDGTEVERIKNVENVRIVDDHLRIRYLSGHPTYKNKKMVVLDSNMDYVFKYYE
jgi:predicted RNA polymerase sigma factor